MDKRYQAGVDTARAGEEMVGVIMMPSPEFIKAMKENPATARGLRLNTMIIDDWIFIPHLKPVLSRKKRLKMKKLYRRQLERAVKQRPIT